MLESMSDWVFQLLILDVDDILLTMILIVATIGMMMNHHVVSYLDM